MLTTKKHPSRIFSSGQKKKKVSDFNSYYLIIIGLQRYGFSPNPQRF